MRARVGNAAAVAGIVAFGLILRIWGMAWGLQGATIQKRPHPDEWVTYWTFRWFQHAGTLNPCPRATKQCFFDWGGGYIYLAYFAHRVLQPLLNLLPPGAFGRAADMGFVETVLVGRGVSVCASTATIVMVYLAGRRAFGTRAGLLGALLVAISALPIQLAHFATPDSLVGLLVVSVLYFALRYTEQSRPLTLVAGGALVGLAAGTEYHMALLLIPLGVAWILDRKRNLHALAGSLFAACIGFVGTNPYALVDAPSFLGAMHHTLLIRTVDSRAQYQGRFDAYGPDWLFIVRYSLGYGAGIGLAIWYVAGFAWALLRRNPACMILLSWILVYGALVSLSVAKFMRYSNPLLPALAIVAGGAADQLMRKRQLEWRIVFRAGLLACSAYGVLYDAAYIKLFTLADSRFAVVQWLQINVSPHSMLAYEQLPNGLINMPYFTSNAGFKPCFTQFHASWAAGPMRYVVTDGYALEEHPRFAIADVLAYRAALANRRIFRTAIHVHYEPSMLGVSFPIDGSPHDWRYVDRDITVFERVGPLGPGQARCYQSVAQAVAALYPHRSTT